MSDLFSQGIERTQSLLLHNLLMELAERDVTLRVTDKGKTLMARPGKNLTPELTQALKEHKKRILQHILDDEMEKTGKLQCVRHVFEMARDEFPDVGKEAM